MATFSINIFIYVYYFIHLMQASLLSSYSHPPPFCYIGIFDLSLSTDLNKEKQPVTLIIVPEEKEYSKIFKIIISHHFNYAFTFLHNRAAAENGILVLRRFVTESQVCQSHVFTHSLMVIIGILQSRNLVH